MRNLRAETFLDAGKGILGVLDGVMEKRGSEGGGIEAHVREDVRDFEQVGQYGSPELRSWSWWRSVAIS